jgi:hypothetical protein
MFSDWEPDLAKQPYTARLTAQGQTVAQVPIRWDQSVNGFVADTLDLIGSQG